MEDVENAKDNRPVEPRQPTGEAENPNTSIHLRTLTLRRFRSCDDITVHFQPDLTVLVGENNGGKSNVIDAIRLLTLPLNGRRERYPEDEDLRRRASPSNFEIVGQYRGLSDTLKGLLISAVPDPTNDVERHFGPGNLTPLNQKSALPI
jgi:putative ATP-dependent endonuclease of OLD family